MGVSPTLGFGGWALIPVMPNPVKTVPTTVLRPTDPALLSVIDSPRKNQTARHPAPAIPELDSLHYKQPFFEFK
jgi:hypothetical protein